MKDLTKIEGCKAVGPQLVTILQNADKLTLQQLKTEVIKVITNPETSISREKAAKYMNGINHKYTLLQMQIFIKDIWCASAGMSITKKIRK